MIKLSELLKDILVKSKKTGKKYDVKKPDPSKHDFTWDYRGSKENPNPFVKSKKSTNEGHCERKPEESDEDFYRRCGNAGFYNKDMGPNSPMDFELPAKHLMRGGISEMDINKPSAKLRPEPHPTRHEREHPSYEKGATTNMDYKFKVPTKK